MGVSHQIANMKSFALVLAFVASASCDAYTVGQVAHGATYGGIVTGVDYGHGLVSGVGAIGNRAVYAHAPAVHSYAAVPAHHGAYYGKREAEADAYTIGQVAAGLPIHNAYATGRAHNVGVITGVSHGVYALTTDTPPTLLFLELTTARERLRLMPTPWARWLLDSLSTTPTPLATPTMSEC